MEHVCKVSELTNEVHLFKISPHTSFKWFCMICIIPIYHLICTVMYSCVSGSILHLYDPVNCW